MDESEMLRRCWAFFAWCHFGQGRDEQLNPAWSFQHSLNEDDYVVVTCSNRWTSLAPLHTAILKAAGYTVEQSSTKTAEGTYKITAKLEGKAGIPFLAQAKAGAEGSYEDAVTDSVTTVPLELDPADVNDIIPALGQIEFRKFIVLEDFHYLLLP